MFNVFEPVALDGVPANIPGTDGLYGWVDVKVEKGTLALLSLYGEVRANAGTAVERVVTGVAWAAFFSQAEGGSGDFKAVPLTSREGTAGRLTWTYSDGRELMRVAQRGPGVFRWGAYRTAAPPAGVTQALARVRGMLLPTSTPVEEVARLLILWRGGA